MGLRPFLIYRLLVFAQIFLQEMLWASIYLNMPNKFTLIKKTWPIEKEVTGMECQYLNLETKLKVVQKIIFGIAVAVVVVA